MHHVSPVIRWPWINFSKKKNFQTILHREFYIFYELSKLRYYEESRGNVLFVKCIVKKTGRKVHKSDFSHVSMGTIVEVSFCADFEATLFKCQSSEESFFYWDKETFNGFPERTIIILKNWFVEGDRNRSTLLLMKWTKLLVTEVLGTTYNPSLLIAGAPDDHILWKLHFH